MTQTAANPRVISGLAVPKPAVAKLPVLELDKRTYSRALDCVHCGLCLPACPTYTQNGLEGDSPRGRIVLMKELADGKIEATDGVIHHLDLCLDCRACETACPSGVVYHELIEETRTRLAAMGHAASVSRMVRFMMFKVLPYPVRLKLAALPARVLQKVGLWKLVSGIPVGDQLGKLRQMMPGKGPLWEPQLKAYYPAAAPDGKKRATVGFFGGCIGSVFFQEVNRQSIALLQLAGCDVVVPRGQGCCGAIHHHGGRAETAEHLAVHNLDAFLGSSPGLDLIVTNIAGCGAMLKEYDHLLRDDAAQAERGKVFAGKVRDISQVLADLRLPKPKKELNLTVTYHDACHLAHAQKITEAPRQLLASIPGLKVVPLAESDMCCGAAGTYNLTQPEMARQLAERKIRKIAETGAAVCVTGNVGCAMQVQSEADRVGMKIEVVHPVTLLHRAYFG